MKTLTLLSVPKTHPSRQERLDAFKAKHGIETHRSDLRREDHPWCACLMPAARRTAEAYMKGDPPTLFNMILHAERLLDEAALLVTGETEREAVATLCDHNGITFDL